MRISDWSSDVCSSDLVPAGNPARNKVTRLIYFGQVAYIQPGAVDNALFFRGEDLRIDIGASMHLELMPIIIGMDYRARIHIPGPPYKTSSQFALTVNASDNAGHQPIGRAHVVIHVP